MDGPEHDWLLKAPGGASTAVRLWGFIPLVPRLLGGHLSNTPVGRIHGTNSALQPGYPYVSVGGGLNTKRVFTRPRVMDLAQADAASTVGGDSLEHGCTR